MFANQIKAGILGATGYAGAELTRILLGHSKIQTLFLSSVSFQGQTMEAVYPSLLNCGSPKSPIFGTPMMLETAESVIEKSDVIFSCLPHGHAEKAGEVCINQGKLFIDISADFRFQDDEKTFSKWYGKPYANKELHAMAVYGLPEMNREAIKKARLIANPGCYPTSAELGLMPALWHKIADTSSFIIDSASGVTGAGREPSQSTHFPEANDAISPYKIGAHRHQPEIDRYVSIMAGTPVETIFTPHLAPMNRGILSTIYFKLSAPLSIDELHEIYASFYKDEPFIRILPAGGFASNRTVKYSNFCDISVHLSSNKKTAIIVSAIDNMVKGAAGQAIQNMNIALGFDETEGLLTVPPAF